MFLSATAQKSLMWVLAAFDFSNCPINATNNICHAQANSSISTYMKIRLAVAFVFIALSPWCLQLLNMATELTEEPPWC